MIVNLLSVVVGLVFSVALGGAVAGIVAWGADQQARQAARVRVQTAAVAMVGVEWFAVLLAPLAARVRPWLQHAWCDPYRRRLDRVVLGLELRSWRSEHVVAATGMLALGLGALVAVGTRCGWAGGFVFGDFVVAVVGGWFRWAWLQRCRAIERALPTVMELLATAVAAGLDLTQATARVTEALPSSLMRRLFDQLRTDLTVGVGHAAAWRGLAVRAAVPAVERFVALLAQAQQLGTPIAALLQAQAAALRAERFQRAERRGAIASQLLLLPTICCILPAYFCLVFGGIVARLVTYGLDGMW